MRDSLIDIITTAIARCCVKRASGEKVDEAAVIADVLIDKGVIAPPCKVGDWIWYVYQNTINKAKVEEIKYDASKHGYYSYSFDVHAYDFKNKREVSYYPINETTKNDANINEVEGMDWDEEVLVFLTREEAEKALAKMQGG